MRRTYSDQDKAQALAALQANGGNLARTARTTGIPRKTLAEWKNGGGVSGVTEEMLEEQRDELADKLERVAHLLVGAIPEAIAAAVKRGDVRGLATSAGIAIDKHNLLKGKPTSITQSLTDKARYEVMIKQMIEETLKESGMKIERREAIRLLQPYVPEISQYAN